MCPIYICFIKSISGFVRSIYISHSIFADMPQPSHFRVNFSSVEDKALRIVVRVFAWIFAFKYMRAAISQMSLAFLFELCAFGFDRHIRLSRFFVCVRVLLSKQHTIYSFEVRKCVYHVRACNSVFDGMYARHVNGRDHRVYEEQSE